MHTLKLKGNGRCKLAWKQKMFSNFHLQASFGGSVNIYTKEVPFFSFSFFFFCFEFEFLEAQPSWFTITKGKQKKIGSWCSWYFCHTFQPCLCHQWCRLLGINWQHSWPCLQGCQTSIFNRQDQKQFLTSRTRNQVEKWLHGCFVFHSCLQLWVFCIPFLSTAMGVLYSIPVNSCGCFVFHFCLQQWVFCIPLLSTAMGVLYSIPVYSAHDAFLLWFPLNVVTVTGQLIVFFYIHLFNARHIPWTIYTHT